MTKLDVNKLAILVVLVIVASIAAVSGYRVEVGWTGFTFEENYQQSITDDN